MRGGIDLGGTKIQAVVVESRSKVRGEARLPTPSEGGPPDVVAAMADALTQAAEAAGGEVGEMSGVGVGSPGAVDSEAGTVAGARNLPGWTDEPYPMASALEERTGTSVKLGNDVQVGVNAEFALGAAKDNDSLLGVFWGTGVGGGPGGEAGQNWEGGGGARRPGGAGGGGGARGGGGGGGPKAPGGGGGAPK